MATEKQLVTKFCKVARPGRLPNYLKRRPRSRSKMRTLLGCKRLKTDSQRSSPLWLGITVISLGVKPLMLLGSLLTLAWGDLRASTMTQRFASSQILIPSSLNKPPQCLNCQKRLKLSRARTKRTLPNPLRRPQTLLSLSPSKILTQGFPRQKLRHRILSFVVYLFFHYVYCFCITFLLRKCITFLLSMKMPFFCFIRHDK